MKKYELTSEYVEFDGRKLYRIKALKRRYLIKAIEKSLHDMSWSTFDGISDQALQNLHTALIAVEKERIVLKK